MKFTDPIQAIEIELLDISCCRVKSTIRGRNNLAGIGRYLNWCIRSSMLDGGQSLNYTVTHKQQYHDEYLLIEGNLINGLNDLCGLCKLSSVLKDNMLNRIVIETASQANAITSAGSKVILSHDLNCALSTNSPPLLRKSIVT